MKINTDQLRSFLAARAPNPSLVDRAMTVSEAAFEAMRSGRFPISSQAETERFDVSAALSGYCGSDVAIELVSLSLPKRMKPETWEKEQWRKIERRITPWVDQGVRIGGGGIPLWEHLGDRYFSQVFDKLAPRGIANDSTLNRFGKCFDNCVPTFKWCANVLPPHLKAIELEGGSIRLGFSYSLKYLFYMTLTGDDRAFACCEHLVGLLGTTVPLGMDDRGRWLIPVI